MRSVYLLAILGACIHTNPPSSASSAEADMSDIPYGTHPSSRLDFYRELDGKPKQLLVFVHGGSWVGGDKGNLELAPGFVDWFLDRDYAVAAPNFRLAVPPNAPPTDVTVEDMASDVAAAIGWLDGRRARYGISDQNIVLVGFSSGAHLVALLASDAHYLEDEGLSLADLRASISLDVHAYDVPLALELMQGSDVERKPAADPKALW